MSELVDAERLAELGDLLRRLADRTGGLVDLPFESLVWNGDAAERFDAVLRALWTDLGRIAVVFALSRTVVDELVAQLAEVMDLSRRADAVERAAADATGRWRRRNEQWFLGGTDAPPLSPVDPGSALRREAADLRSRASGLHEHVTDSAAERLDRIADQIPSDAPLYESLGDFAGEFAGGVWDALRGTAEFLWDFSLVRAVADPDGYVDDVVAVAGGIGYAATHPVEGVAAMVDWETWKTNPARAAGRLVPDVAMSMATGGGAGAARRTASAVDDVVDAARVVDRIDDAPAMAALIRPDDVTRPIINLTAPGDRMGDFAARVTPIDGFRDVAIHGSPTSFSTTPFGRALTPGDVADLLTDHPRFGSEPIRLISCSSGADDAGAAARLADELDVTVMAPDRTLWVYPDGRLVVGEGEWRGTRLDITDPGTWRTFEPTGGTR